jgi:hypothetical protein
MTGASQAGGPRCVDILPSLIQNRLVRDSLRGNAMEPRIQYARTADGVSIAYWTRVP